jgi:hypothetical protein
MVPSRFDIVGRWSENLGYLADLNCDTVLEFSDDGSMTISGGNERIDGSWELPSPGLLVLVTDKGYRYGPFTVRIEQRRLPLGLFAVLESDGALVPFGRKRFTRIEA